MGEGAHVEVGAELAHRVEVGAVGLEQQLGEGAVGAGQRLAVLELVLADDVPNQRVAVGVQSAAGQAEDRVAGAHPGAVDDPVALDHADDEAGEVVVSERVQAGHLRGLAAEERASRRRAGGGDALDDLGELLGVEPAGGEVVEEEDRFGAAA